MQKRLGDILIDEGILSVDKIKEAIDHQRSSGKRLGDILVELQYVMEDQVQDALSKQLGIEKIDLYEEKVDPEVARLIPADMIKRHMAFPVRLQGNILVVAMVDPTNLLALDDIRLSTGYDVAPRICSPHALDFAFEHFFGVSHEAQKSIDEYKQEQISKGLIVDTTLVDKAILAEIEEAPIVKFVEQILNGAVDYRASDIHLEPKEDKMIARYRVDGMLRQIFEIPKFAIAAVTARLKILARLDTTERRKPQDGRIDVILREKEIDIRFSTLPTLYGEKIVMRLLNKSAARMSLVDLGFEKTEFDKFDQMINTPYGVILITGPTGSGKSTTLIAALEKIASETVNVVTIEDPVEYQLDKINQVHVNPKIGLTFATGLRTIVRQDPDIIMVGEIRDPETADLAIQASLTGHLVLSTLHTNDAPGAIPRLENMGVPAYLIEASLLGVMAQRLVRILCPHCKKSVEAGAEEIEALEPAFPALDIEKDTKEIIIYKPQGCKFCNQIGYIGRSGIFEIMPATQRMRHMILQRASVHAVRQSARQEGMLSLFESGVHKVLRGQISIEELYRVARPEEDQLVEGVPAYGPERVPGKLAEAAAKLAEAGGTRATT